MAFFRRESQRAPPPSSGRAGDGTRDALVAPGATTRALADEPDEPPVVARMVIEIRSDGTRTIARGALEDVQSGERVAVQAHGSTPMALAASLAKTIFSAPALARHAVRALIENRLRRP
jgi:hypothetical protein